jgi:predicted RNA-binding protein with PIN domain
VREIAVGERAGVPHYLIDGYNVILSGGYGGRGGAGPRGEVSVEDARFYFLRELSEYVRKKRVRMTVVWDGGSSGVRSRSETKNGVQSIYTPSGLSADEQIVRMVERRANARELTVVSNDRRHIIGVVRNLGAQTMAVSQFLTLISPKAGRTRSQGVRASTRGGMDETVEKKKANDLSVDEWMRLFSLHKNRGGNES